MINKKVLIGSVVGGIAYFLLGWIIYGILMKDFFTANFSQDGMRAEADMILWAMGIANIASAMLVSLVFSWANINQLLSGARIAGIMGFLISLSIDLSFYSMTTMFKNWTGLIVDVVMGTIMSAIVGAIIVWAMSLGKKEA